MMTKTFLSKIGLALVGMMIVCFAAFAAQGEGHKGHGGRGPGGPGGGDLMKLAQKLNITDDQKAQIKALRDQFQQQNAGTLGEVKALHEKMKEYRKSDDKTNAMATREQIKTKMESLRPAHEQLRAKMLAILTADQRAQLEQMKAERKEKGGKRHGDCKGKAKGSPNKGGDAGTSNGGSTIK